MKASLITGVTGQDGSYLAELLLAKGYEVHGLIRRHSTPCTERIEHLIGAEKATWRGCKKVYTIPNDHDGIYFEDISRDFYLANKSAFDEVYDNLADDLSRDSLRAYLMLKIIGDPCYIAPFVVNPPYFFTPAIWKTNDSDVYLDGGTFDGDSALGFVNFTGGKYKKIIACEPDPANFKALQENLSARGVKNFIALNVGLSDKEDVLKFATDNGMSSQFSSDGDVEIPIDTIDNITAKIGGGYNISVIKLNVKGFEVPSLIGARNTIVKNRPVLIVTVMNRRDDVFKVYQYVNSVASDYKFYFRIHRFNGSDSTLFAVPKERSI